ncbi:MAG: hemerythrin domain-containing protein [Myxococcota bacterium]
MNAPTLLNDDGTASMATLLMMSHHGLRRDAARLEARVKQASVVVLREAWEGFAAVLHGHHTAEDERLLPGLRKDNAELGRAIDGLGADHRAMDQLIQRVGGALASSEDRAAPAVATALGELTALLRQHLTVEEATVIPILRRVPVQSMPPLPESELAVMAQGLAWSAEGVANDVVTKAFAGMPDVVMTKFAAARAEYAVKCTRLWGGVAEALSRTADGSPVR